jgi:hypothetical protein
VIVTAPDRSTAIPWPTSPVRTSASPARYARTSPNRRMRSISAGASVGNTWPRRASITGAGAFARTYSVSCCTLRGCRPNLRRPDARARCSRSRSSTPRRSSPVGSSFHSVSAHPLWVVLAGLLAATGGDVLATLVWRNGSVFDAYWSVLPPFVALYLAASARRSGRRAPRRSCSSCSRGRCG